MALPQLRMIGDLCDSQIGHAYLMTQFRLRCSETPGKKCIPFRYMAAAHTTLRLLLFECYTRSIIVQSCRDL